MILHASSQEQQRAPERRFREPSDEDRCRLYDFYELIHASPFGRSKKRTLMTVALGEEPWSWRVVGISVAAIQAIARNNFNHPAHQLARDHIVPRAQTYDEIFSGALLPLDRWWSLVWENDRTRLLTHDEHHRRQRLTRIIDIDPSLGFFMDAPTAGWYHSRRREGEFVRCLAINEGIEW
jgi:hypothetical protein